MKGEWAAGHEQVVGKAALIASVGGQRGFADWTNPDHRLRRLLSEFIGMAGLTFVLSGGAAILARYGGRWLQPWQTVMVLSLVSALWLVVAVYFLGDTSAHFNPATTLAFALRRDTDWLMASVMILNLANGPKLNGPFVPLAAGDYVMAWGTMGGPFDGASMNPAHSFGPDVAIGNLDTLWVYLSGRWRAQLLRSARHMCSALDQVPSVTSPLSKAATTACTRFSARSLSRM